MIKNITVAVLLTCVSLNANADNISIDLAGLGSGTSINYQIDLDPDTAVRINYISTNTVNGLGGYYKIYSPASTDNMKPYIEGGLTIGDTGGFALGALLGFEMHTGTGIFIDPFFGLVAGTGGSAAGYGLNIGYAF